MRDERFITLDRLNLGLTAFGFIFAAFGLVAVCGMLLGGGEVQVGEDHPRPATPADVWMPGIFVMIGLGLTQIRSRRVLDVERRVCVHTRGWGPWVRRTETPLPELTHITIDEARERGDGSGRYTSIPIMAIGPAGPTELAEPRTRHAAHALARRLATALRLPISDAAAPERPIGAVHDLDRPLAELVKLVPPNAGMLRPPAGSRITLSELPRGIELRIPPNQTVLLSMLFLGMTPLLMGIALSLVVWYPGSGEWATWTTEDRWLALVPVLLGSLPLVCMIGTVLWHGAGGGMLCVDAERGLRTWRHRVAPQRLRGLEIRNQSGAHRSIVVITDCSEFLIAGYREADEVHWLRTVVLQHLAAR
jgi:hypothetical protein